MNQHELTRRAVLRGMVATGCTMLVPALGGCGKSPPEPETTPTQPAAGTPETMPAPDAAAPTGGGKASKQVAEYQDQPKGDERCDNCRFFIASSNACELVEGDISPQGWCKFWVATA